MLKLILPPCTLFQGIESSQLETLFQCLQAQQQSYSKDEFIFRVDDPALYVGIILSGSAHIIQEDFWGNRTILAHVEAGELFGEAFSCAETTRLPISVIACEHTEVLLIDYRRIATTCSSACTFHARMIANMLQILAEKNIVLTRKLEHISKRTTREKLLSFLSAQAMRNKSNRIILPFNRQELADYLCVERSALSRELAAMKKAGLLIYSRNYFELM